MLQTMDVRSRKKLDSYLDALKRDNRRYFVETFYDYEGKFYVVFYRTKEV